MSPLAIQDFLRAEGIDLRLGARCISMRKENEGLSVGLDCLEGAPREQGTHLLLAVGRVPNTDDLGLDTAGIKTDSRGYIEVDEAFALPTLTSGRWATATARAPSPTPLTTTTRSSPTTCSRTPDENTPTAYRSMRSTRTRRLAASA